MALCKLAPQLPEVLLEALESARAIQDESVRAEVLCKLALHLPEVLPEALESARAIQDESVRAKALRKLAPHLPEVLLEALESARAIQDESVRADPFRELLLQLNLSSVEFCVWQKILRVLSCRSRKYFLKNIAILSPTIIRLGGLEALAATVDAMREVCQQWK